MPHTICYNIPSKEIDTKSIPLLELFIDEWLDKSCLERYKFTVTERFCSEEVRLDVQLDSAEDAFYLKLGDIPEQLPEFKRI